MQCIVSFLPLLLFFSLFFFFFFFLLATVCVSTNSTLSLYKANIFDAVVSVSQGAGNVANPADRSRALSDDDQPLGYDMYYYVRPDGSIPLVMYDSQDSLYYVQVKLAAINCFQTSTYASQKTVDDPSGVHLVSYTLPQTNTVHGAFNAESYQSFMDPSVSARNVQINALNRAEFHPSGYISVGSTQQNVLLVRGQAGNVGAAQQKRDSDDSGYSYYMASTGVLSATVQNTNGNRLSRLPQRSMDNLVAAPMSVVARTVHHAQMKLRSREVADRLPQLMSAPKDESFGAVMPHIHCPIMQKALRKLAKQGVRMPNKQRFLRLAAAAGMADVLVKFMPTHPLLTVDAIWHSGNEKLATPALCAALSHVRKAAQVAVHIKCPGASLALAQKPVPSQFQVSLPFNRTGGKTVSIGGKTLGLTFVASYLVGTNLNCKNAQFAYEATADLTGSINLFGQTEQAFDANFIYGQNGAQQFADAATLTAFGKQVWSQQVPSYSYCQKESLPIGQIQKGISLTHTVWVSIVPVTFAASADLTLSLSWQWSLCTNDLSATVGLTPGAAVSLTGSTLVDLLVLRAGVNLQGNLAANVVPTVGVYGTRCSAGVDVVLNKPGDTGLLYGYYQWRSCKWLLFDCKWDQNHQTTFWSHNGQPSASLLYNKTYTIQK